jgi:hypothetical protein
MWKAHSPSERKNVLNPWVSGSIFGAANYVFLVHLLLTQILLSHSAVRHSNTGRMRQATGFSVSQVCMAGLMIQNRWSRPSVHDCQTGHKWAICCILQCKWWAMNANRTVDTKRQCRWQRGNRWQELVAALCAREMECSTAQATKASGGGYML